MRARPSLYFLLFSKIRALQILISLRRENPLFAFICLRVAVIRAALLWG
jgi:hypothetical protein